MAREMQRSRYRQGCLIFGVFAIFAAFITLLATVVLFYADPEPSTTVIIIGVSCFVGFCAVGCLQSALPVFLCQDFPCWSSKASLIFVPFPAEEEKSEEGGTYIHDISDYVINEKTNAQEKITNRFIFESIF